MINEMKRHGGRCGLRQGGTTMKLKTFNELPPSRQTHWAYLQVAFNYCQKFNKVIAYEPMWAIKSHRVSIKYLNAVRSELDESTPHCRSKVSQSCAQERSAKESLTLGPIINIADFENMKINGVRVHPVKLEMGDWMRGKRGFLLSWF